VYCPKKKELVHLHDPDNHPLGALLINYPNLNFLGEKIEKDEAIKICTGVHNPITRETYKEIVPIEVVGGVGGL